MALTPTVVSPVVGSSIICSSIRVPLRVVSRVSSSPYFDTKDEKENTPRYVETLAQGEKSSEKYKGKELIGSRSLSRKGKKKKLGYNNLHKYPLSF